MMAFGRARLAALKSSRLVLTALVPVTIDASRAALAEKEKQVFSPLQVS